jgi:spore maturation protein CgeB
MAAMNRALLTVARQMHPDLLLASKAMGVTIETVQQLCQLGVVTANWFPDDLQHFDWISRAVNVYTHFFSFDTYTVSLLRNKSARNVYYLPLACDPALHRTVVLSDEERACYTCEVAFVGAPYPERAEALQALSGFDLKIWGYDGWRQTDLSRFYQGIIDNGEPLVRLYNACRVAVNIHWKSAAHGANYRTFEIAGSGAFQIADARADIPQLFEPDREIVLFDGPDDLKEKVNYYLRHEDERRAIARAGQARAYRDHTIYQRMQQLLEIAGF